MAERQDQSVLVQVCVSLFFTGLGVYCSTLLFGAPSIETGSREQETMSCDQVAAASAIPFHNRTFMGTKLPYQFETDIIDETHLNSCTAVKVYGVYRHGTRYPTSSKLRKWDELVRRLKDSRVTSDLGVYLLEWSSAWSDAMTGAVTSHGLWEQYCLANRLKQRYPALLSTDYSNVYYSLRSSGTSRTVQSGLAFARGLFEDRGPVRGYQPVHLHTVDKDRDVLLRYHDTDCPVYLQSVLQNKTVTEMLSGYLATEEITKVVTRIREVFNVDWLSADDVRSLFILCVHETSLLGGSRWCELFSDRELLTFAYYSDLRTFWFKGPGLAITGHRSINLLQELATFLAADQGSKVMLRFGHAETLLPLLALIGAVNNTPYLDSQYKEQRNFKSSKLAPFSANLLAVKYHCTDSEDFVRFLLNEQPLQLGLCGQQELCSLSVLLEAVNTVTDNRTLEQLCVYS